MAEGAAGEGRIAGEGSRDQLSAPESGLVRAALAGERADLQGQPVRAGLVRELLLEARQGWALPASGLRVDRAVIQGRLDLEGATLLKPLVLHGCRLEGGDGKALVLSDGRFRRIVLADCAIEGHIDADRAEIDHDLTLRGGQLKGALRLSGASIGGTLLLEGAHVGDGSQALLAAGLRLKGSLILREATCAGAVAVPRSTLEGGLFARQVRITAGAEALDAESARISGDVLLGGAEIAGGIRLLNVRLDGRLAGERMAVAGLPTAIDARGLDVSHGIVLDHARLNGSLLFDGARVGTALQAEGLEIDGGETAIGADVIEVRGNWAMPRAKLIGQLSCPGARIEGQLRLTEARLYGADTAIRGDGASIRGGCFLSRSAILGLVRFPAAEIGNQLRLRGASIRVEAGAALLASGTTFRRDVELTEGCHMAGAVVLDQVRIMGALDLRGSRLVSAGLTRGGLPVPPAWAAAAAHADEIALSLVDAEVNRLVMPVLAEDRPRGIVDLSRAHAGSFEDYADAWVPPPRARGRTKDGRDIDHIVLDGFVYDHLTNPAGMPPTGGAHHKAEDRVATQRLHWLAGQSEGDTGAHFKPQAWVALADRLTRQGYHDDARRIEIARRRRERRSHAVTAGARWQGRLLDWLALYGHNPWRTVLWMAAVVVLFAGVWGGAAQLCKDEGCFDETVMVIRNKDAYREDRFRQTYPAFHPLAYSFDVFVPFVSFGYEDHWRPNLDYGPIAELPLPWPRQGPPPEAGSLAKDPTIAITIGGVLYVLGIIEAMLGLVLTSLMVTGFTGLLKGRGD